MTEPTTPKAHSAPLDPAWANLEWRQGRRNPCTIYAVFPDDPGNQDAKGYIGSLRLPEFTADAVAAHNLGLAYLRVFKGFLSGEVKPTPEQVKRFIETLRDLTEGEDGE